MATVVSRESYFDIGFEVLSDRGYGGLKLAEVCGRLGVTTGSFYHYFTNWSAYTKELVAHWVQARTVRIVERVRTEPDPRRRIDTLIQEGLALPHGAEAAIRVWSSIDPDGATPSSWPSTNSASTVLFESAFEVLAARAPGHGVRVVGASTAGRLRAGVAATRPRRSGMDRRPAARRAGLGPIRARPRRRT